MLSTTPIHEPFQIEQYFELLEVIKGYIKIQQFSEALALTQKLIAANKQHTDELFLLQATAYEKLGQIPAAIFAYDAGFKLFPNSHQLHFQMASLSNKINDVKNALYHKNEAKKQYDILKYDEIKFRKCYHAAFQHKQPGEFSLGKKFLPNTNDLPSDEAAGFAFLAERAHLAMKNELSIYYETLAIKAYPQDFLSFAMRGIAFNKLGQCDKALEDYNTSVAISGNFQAHWGRANIYLANKLLSKARDEMIYALKYYMFNKVKLEHGINERRLVVKIIFPENNHSESKSAPPKSLSQFLKVGHNYCLQSKWLEAIETYTHALTYYPIENELYADRAFAKSKLKIYDSALLDYSLAIWLNQSKNYILNLSRVRQIYIEIGDRDTAQLLHLKIIKNRQHVPEENIARDFAEELAEKGNAELLDENFTEAVSLYNHAISISGVKRQYYISRGIALRKLNFLDLADTDCLFAESLKTKNQALSSSHFDTLSGKYANVLTRLFNPTKITEKNAIPSVDLPQNNIETTNNENKSVRVSKDKPKKPTLDTPKRKPQHSNSEIHKAINAATNDELQNNSNDIADEKTLQNSINLAQETQRKHRLKQKAKKKTETRRLARQKNQKESQSENLNVLAEENSSSVSLPAEPITDLSSESKTLATPQPKIINQPLSFWCKTGIQLSLSPIEELCFSMLKSDKIKTYLYGGAIRDRLSGLALNRITDFDFFTETSGEEIINLFKNATNLTIIPSRNIPNRYQIYQDTGESMDITCLSSFNSIHESCLTKDFTMNALFVDTTKMVFDPTQRGLRDIAQKIIATVIPALESFQQDPLRILRAIYFLTKLGFTLHPDIIEAIPKTKHLLVENLPAGQVNFWLRKLFSNGKASINYRLLDEFGIIEVLFPTLHNALRIDNLWLEQEMLQTDLVKSVSLPLIYSNFLISTVLQKENLTEKSIIETLQSNPLLNLSLSNGLYINHLLQGAIVKRTHFYDTRATLCYPAQ